MTDETTARDRAAEVAEAEEWLRSVVSYPRRKRDVAPASAALAGLEQLRALAGAPPADVAARVDELTPIRPRSSGCGT